MTTDDTALTWRNLAVDWHLKQDVPLECGCDDDTPDDKLCEASVFHADRLLGSRPDPELAGDADVWNHAVWVAAWGHNATLIVGDELRLPKAPAGMGWLATRLLTGGRRAIELVLYRLGEHNIRVLSRGRVDPDPAKVEDRARRMMQDLTS